MFIPLLGVSLHFPHSSLQSGKRAARWMDVWLRLGEDSHVPHQLDLDGLVDLDDLIVALSQGIALGDLTRWSLAGLVLSSKPR
jgi:hypothetical protein